VAGAGGVVVGALEGGGVGLGCGLAGEAIGGMLAVDDGDGPATVGPGERRGRDVGSIRSAQAARGGRQSGEQEPASRQVGIDGHYTPPGGLLPG
jgi:hypothetical protein